MPKVIIRHEYLKKIKPFINKQLIKIIIGQRRVGKSYLLLQIINLLKKRGVNQKYIIHINKELEEFNNIVNDQDLLAYVHQQEKKFPQNSNQKIYLFIDEVQEIINFEKAVRNLAAANRYDIYLSGSNANLLSTDLATLLSGRYIEFKVYSLSYVEFLKFHQLKDSQHNWYLYLKYGGLPYLRNLVFKDEVVFEYLRSVYNTIFLKDIVKRYQLRNVAFLEQLARFTADNVGNLLSAKKISDFLKSQRVKISPSVIQDYLKYMCEAMMIYQVDRMDLQGKKIFEINQKYYFEDLGIRHAIVGYKQTDINKILENVVYLHLLIKGYKVFIGQLASGKEIDFVASKGNDKLYIQVAYLLVDQKTIDREFGNLLAVSDNYRKIVLSMDEGMHSNYHGVEHLSIREFLLY